MNRKLIIFLIFIILSGCAPNNDVGSQVWYDKRIQEIESSYTSKEITKADYIRLKNEADAIRSDYMNNGALRTGVGLHYGIFR
jgi:hypothetical protein